MCKNIICNMIAIVIGIIIAVVVGLLIANAGLAIAFFQIPLIGAILISAVILISMLVISAIYALIPRGDIPICYCENGKWISILAVLTMIGAFAGYLVSLAVTGVAAAITLGIVSGLFVALSVSAVCWIFCVIASKCHSCK